MNAIGKGTINNMETNTYLSKFYKGTKGPTLEAIQYFMEQLDFPQNKLKIVHVAGTNGKGSVCEMLSNVLEKAGYIVGKFMSPHIIKFNERICVNHQEISDEELEKYIKIMNPIVEQYNENHSVKVTLFELETAVALLHFVSKKCDIVIMETGLGGLCDCTNIVYPMISMITSIGYDHMDILGKTLEEITIQKAGIIKQNSETIFIKQEPQVNEIIEQTCKQKNNELHLISPQDWSKPEYNGEYQVFHYKGKQIEINLKGKKQIGNACMVLEAVKILQNKGYNIPEEAIENGFKTVVHKARFEKIYEHPLMIFDGGHNEAAIQNLKETIKQYYPQNKKIYIISILKTKDYKTVIKELIEDKDASFIFTDGTKDKDEVKCYVEKETLYEEALKYRKDNIYMDSLENAINKCKQECKDEVVFIVGSFYTYQEVIQNLKK